jgi:hypothetical protein
MAALAAACRATASSSLAAAQRSGSVVLPALHHLLPSHQQACQYSDAPDIIPLQRKQQQQQPATTSAGQRQELAVPLPEQNVGPWERVIDKATGQPYYFNPKTGVTTPTGAPQPDAWVAVRDERTQAQYYWNKQSGVCACVLLQRGPTGQLCAHKAVLLRCNEVCA